MLILPWEPCWSLSGAMSSSLMTEDQWPETWLWFVSVLCLPYSGWCCSIDTPHPRETKTGSTNTSADCGFSCLIKFSATWQIPNCSKTRPSAAPKFPGSHLSLFWFGLGLWFHLFLTTVMLLMSETHWRIYSLCICAFNSIFKKEVWTDY